MKLKKLLVLVPLFLLLVGCGKDATNNSFTTDDYVNTVNGNNIISNEINIEMEPTIKDRDVVDFFKYFVDNDFVFELNRTKDFLIDKEEYSPLGYIILHKDINGYEDYGFVQINFKILKSNYSYSSVKHEIEDFLDNEDINYYDFGYDYDASKVQNSKEIDNLAVFFETNDLFVFKALKGNLYFTVEANKSGLTEKEFMKVFEEFYNDKLKNFDGVLSIEDLFVVDFYIDTKGLTMTQIDDKLYELRQSFKEDNRDYWDLFYEEDDRIEKLFESKNNEIIDDEIEFYEDYDPEYDDEFEYVLYNEGITSNEFFNDMENILKDYNPELDFNYNNPEVLDDYDYLGLKWYLDSIVDGKSSILFYAYPMTKDDLALLKEELLTDTHYETNELNYKEVEENVFSDEQFNNYFYVFSENVFYKIYKNENESISDHQELINSLKSYNKIINLKDMVNFYLD